MRIIGCDLHSRQQTLAMLDVDTGQVEERVLRHEGKQGTRVLCRAAGSGTRGYRSDRLDAVVFGVDGRSRRGVLGGASR